MGLIDSKKAIKALTHWETEATDEEIIYTINNLPTVEAIPKDQYEARLKADLASLLRFLWNEIEDLDAPICDYASSDCISKWQVHELIQQRINELKEQKDETDKSNK